MATDPTRRRLLSLGAATLAGLAGCAGDRTAGNGTGTPTSEDPPSTSGDSPTATPTGTPTATSTTAPPTSDGAARATATTPAFDLREANVVSVTVDRRDDGTRFDVTLYHDDDGEAGYANWWQVETVDGDRLGRRDLAHPHGTREFTRSATIQVPDGVDCVAVRGHDQTHGYGGRAMIVNPATGAAEPVGQGSTRRSLSDRDC